MITIDTFCKELNNIIKNSHIEFENNIISFFVNDKKDTIMLHIVFNSSEKHITKFGHYWIDFPLFDWKRKDFVYAVHNDGGYQDDVELLPDCIFTFIEDDSLENIDYLFWYYPYLSKFMDELYGLSKEEQKDKFQHFIFEECSYTDQAFIEFCSFVIEDELYLSINDLIEDWLSEVAEDLEKHYKKKRGEY